MGWERRALHWKQEPDEGLGVGRVRTEGEGIILTSLRTAWSNVEAARRKKDKRHFPERNGQRQQLTAHPGWVPAGAPERGAECSEVEGCFTVTVLGDWTGPASLRSRDSVPTLYKWGSRGLKKWSDVSKASKQVVGRAGARALTRLPSELLPRHPELPLWPWRSRRLLSTYITLRDGPPIPAPARIPSKTVRLQGGWADSTLGSSRSPAPTATSPDAVFKFLVGLRATR